MLASADFVKSIRFVEGDSRERCIHIDVASSSGDSICLCTFEQR
jgi:hypothetical protein